MMSSDDRCFVCGWTGHLAVIALMTTVIAVMNLATLFRTAPTRFLHQQHQATMEILFKTLIYTQPQGQITPYYGPRHRKHYNRSQSCPDSHHERSRNQRRHTSCSSSRHHSSSHCPPGNGHSHYPSCSDTNRHSHIPSCTCHLSHRHH